MFGFINIYKPENITSFDVIAYLRKITKIKQIGHAGTLDPFAVGVLPIAIGKATRLIEYLPSNKEYIAEITFGKNTDTYDCTGTITDEFEKKITVEDLKNCIPSFIGEIEQFPPIYSAIKVNGKKLYDYAREKKEVKIESRRVNIKDFIIKNFNYETQKAEVLIKCSSGTYIRSIAFDIGKRLGCGAYLSNLIRTESSSFRIENSIKLENIKSEDDVLQNIFMPKFIYPEYEITKKEAEMISNGKFLLNKNNLNNGDKIILIYNNHVKAVACINNEMIKADKVFNL